MPMYSITFDSSRNRQTRSKHSQKVMGIVLERRMKSEEEEEEGEEEEESKRGEEEAIPSPTQPYHRIIEVVTGKLKGDMAPVLNSG